MKPYDLEPSEEAQAKLDPASLCSQKKDCYLHSLRRFPALFESRAARIQPSAHAALTHLHACALRACRTEGP